MSEARVLEIVLLGLAAACAGAVNAVAGGGTLITFPALVAAGLSPLAANVTNSVAMAPGYLGAALAQAPDIAAERDWLRRGMPAAFIGGAAGAGLLLATGERAFAAAAPWLILLAAGLLAIQGRVRRWLARRETGAVRAAGPKSIGHADRAGAGALASVGAAAIYSGYFGAGASVIVLAILGLLLERSLQRLNGIKQALALASNTAAAACYALSAGPRWSLVLVMAPAAIGGGALGARLAGRLHPVALRCAVVGLGVVVGVTYLVRGT